MRLTPVLLPPLAAAAVTTAAIGAGPPAAAASSERPLIPPEAGECFAPRRDGAAAPQTTLYRPALVGAAVMAGSLAAVVDFGDVTAGSSMDRWLAAASGVITRRAAALAATGQGAAGEGVAGA